MTISDKLIALNTAKQNIKNAIEAKGVSTAGASFGDLAAKVSEITGGGQVIYDPEPTPWVRPVDWKELQEIPAGVTGGNFLYAVFEHETTWSVQVETVTNYATVIIDWGDGTPNTTVSSGSGGNTGVITHVFDYNGITPVEGSTRQYRQAVVTIRTSSPTSHISAIDGSVKNPGDLRANQTNNVLEAIGRLESKQFNSTKIRLGGGSTNSAASPLLERVKVETLSTYVYSLNLAYCYAGAKRLKKVELPTVNSGSATTVSCFTDCFELTEVINFPYIVSAASGTFTNCYKLKRLTLPNNNFANLSYADSFFVGCISLVESPNWSTPALTRTNRMFEGCTSLKKVHLFDTSKCTLMSAMFGGCSSLTSIPNFDFSAATDVSSVFSGTAISEFPSVNFPLATDAFGMFKSCKMLTNPGTLNLPSATSVNGLFQDCHNLNSQPYIVPDNLTVSVTDMYAGCLSLDTAKVTNGVSNAFGTGVFTGCSGLITLDATGFSKPESSVVSQQMSLSGTGSLASLSVLTISDGATTGMNISGSNIKTDKINSIIDQLGQVKDKTSSNMSFTITGCTGALNSPATASATFTVSNSSNVVVAPATYPGTVTPTVGMCVTGTHFKTVSYATTGVFTLANHFFSNGDIVAFSQVGGPVILRKIYYVTVIDSSTFKISNTLEEVGSVYISGGTASTTGRIITNNKIVAIDGRNFTLNYPVLNSGVTSLALIFREINTQLATMKGYTVTG